MDNTIVGNDELISFDYYMDRLFEISKDCNHENYLGEIIIPLLRSCCIEGIKVVPIYDDRATGPKVDTPIKKRMETICAPYNGKYVVPDYIFVPQEYSFENPKTPYLMVETKKPRIIDGSDKYYKKLSYQSENIMKQLKAEIDAFGRGYVIFTDGITWEFLEIRSGKIEESEKHNTISLVNMDMQKQHYYTYAISKNPNGWGGLKDNIKALLKEIKNKDKPNQ